MSSCLPICAPHHKEISEELPISLQKAQNEHRPEEGCLSVCLYVYITNSPQNSHAHKQSERHFEKKASDLIIQESVGTK